MLDVELKAATKHEHALLEKQFLQLIRGLRNLTDYGSFLRLIYGYYVAIENRLEPILLSEAAAEYSSRMKRHLLQRDLEVCDVAHSGSPECADLPEIDTYPKALGALYVLEGSTLGGQIIAKIVGKTIGEDGPVSFFNCYGVETDNMWQRFKELLQHPFSEEEQQEVVATATATFTSFRNWLSNQ